MADSYEWRKSAADRFEHLFAVGRDDRSLCGRVASGGEAMEAYDPAKRGGRGVAGILCPHCRRVVRRQRVPRG